MEAVSEIRSCQSRAGTRSAYLCALTAWRRVRSPVVIAFKSCNRVRSMDFVIKEREGSSYISNRRHTPQHRCRRAQEQRVPSRRRAAEGGGFRGNASARQPPPSALSTASARHAAATQCARWRAWRRRHQLPLLSHLRGLTVRHRASWRPLTRRRYIWKGGINARRNEVKTIKQRFISVALASTLCFGITATFFHGRVRRNGCAQRARFAHFTRSTGVTSLRCSDSVLRASSSPPRFRSYVRTSSPSN